MICTGSKPEIGSSNTTNSGPVNDRLGDTHALLEAMRQGARSIGFATSPISVSSSTFATRFLRSLLGTSRNRAAYDKYSRTVMSSYSGGRSGK